MLIKEFVQPMGMTQVNFARHLGSTKARLNELIRGKQCVNTESALDLAEEVSAGHVLQARWDLHLRNNYLAIYTPIYMKI
ncbi:MAG: plasmid maintenance system antidote protein VapI [Candidatus Azotimanducaceae bacterium]|jgi:plasmid maintenance system antidote protein VapI